MSMFRTMTILIPGAFGLMTVSVSPPAATQTFLRSEPDTGRSSTFEGGLGVEAGIGVANFLDTDAAKATAPGPAWTARVTFGTRRVLAGELAYIGETHAVNALGLDDGAVLVGSGLEAVARLAVFTFELDDNPDWVLKTYGVAGLALKHFDLAGSNFNTSNVANHDNLLEIPLGVGLSWRYRRLLFDQRFVLRPAFGSDLFDRSTIDAQSLATWSLTARGGFEF